ncbi:hypothetical protein ATCV1_z165R [Acanthocystis turfacea chlorella virus 1]|uniref:Uncharacterized protein z165R n=1 Tax=Chlorovirus heliozoae TaxID=322019 RepID=A7K8C5_9PHYC|nr:hypothetical protein ATCV1_z165R [Acanthocystis turfacea chlorella virus 1]ABT16299.1 hypothetical protein ATCV1_z165R [Acanthocystis turfacea chlorella virus 1]
MSSTHTNLRMEKRDVQMLTNPLPEYSIGSNVVSRWLRTIRLAGCATGFLAALRSFASCASFFLYTAHCSSSITVHPPVVTGGATGWDVKEALMRLTMSWFMTNVEPIIGSTGNILVIVDILKIMYISFKTYTLYKERVDISLATCGNYESGHVLVRHLAAIAVMDHRLLLVLGVEVRLCVRERLAERGLAAWAQLLCQHDLTVSAVVDILVRVLGLVPEQNLPSGCGHCVYPYKLLFYISTLVAIKHKPAFLLQQYNDFRRCRPPVLHDPVPQPKPEDCREHGEECGSQRRRGHCLARALQYAVLLPGAKWQVV